MIRKTKIIATLGPASEKIVDELIKYVDVIRLNFAHGDEEQHEKYFSLVNDRVPILVDLPGPKLRLGILKEGKMELRNGEIVEFGDKGLPVDDPLFFKLIKPGIEVLISDGKVRVKIVEVDENKAKGVVEEGGIVTSRKGINIPDANTPIGITERDLQLLREALKLGATFVGLSFVISADDVEKVKSIVGDKAWVISKIEKKGALENLKEIIKKSDGVMVARGDLGVEIGLANLPQTQRRIIRLSRLYGKPVILATQVLESMVSSPIPTRAEVIDVANSVSQGVDAIMLSDETAMGQYPLEAVKTLHALITNVEKNFKPRKTRLYKNVDEAIAYSTIIASYLASCKAIFTYTRTGSTALRISRLRPNIPIYALTPSRETEKRIRMCYGVIPIVIRELKNIDEVINEAKGYSRRLGIKGNITIVGGVSSDAEGTTRFLKVEEVN